MDDSTSVASGVTLGSSHAYEGHHIGSFPISLIPGREMCMSVTLKESLQEKGNEVVHQNQLDSNWFVRLFQKELRQCKLYASDSVRNCHGEMTTWLLLLQSCFNPRKRSQSFSGERANGMRRLTRKRRRRGKRSTHPTVCNAVEWAMPTVGRDFAEHVPFLYFSWQRR
jgi:hypothetical protein